MDASAVFVCNYIYLVNKIDGNNSYTKERERERERESASEREKEKMMGKN